MTDDTAQVTGYGERDGRVTVQFDYQINGRVYSTEHFLDAYGESPTAGELTSALQSWVISDAKPQLAPEQPAVSADLQNLITQA